MNQNLQFIVELVDNCDFSKFAKEIEEKGLFKRVMIYTQNFLKISDRLKTYFFDPSEILFLEANGNYTYIHTDRKEKYIFSYPIKKIMSLLPEKIFLRVHRSYAVNLMHVRSLQNHSIMMKNQLEIPLSKRRKKDISKIRDVANR